MSSFSLRSTTAKAAEPVATRTFAATRPFALQAKLRIGAPGDRYEQEADRVAGEVMRMPQSRTATLSGPPSIQRLCSRCEEELQRQAENEEEEEEEEMLHAKPGSSETLSAMPQTAAQVRSLRGGGVPLSTATRAFFEPRFDHDFSQVRIHADQRGAESAKALNARAFTYGSDIAFATGEYAPESHSGRLLLAHELTHVVQQAS